MEYIILTIKYAIEDFKRNKVRTFLTSLGILIGVASVVLLIAFGLGLKKFIKEQFESLGTNVIYIAPGKILQGRGFRAGGGALGGAQFDEKDVTNLKKIENVDYVVPVFIKSVTAENGTESEIADVFATTEDIFKLRKLKAEYGQLFTKSDVQKKSRIVVIGPKIAEELFGKAENALNRTIKIDRQGFRVIGILEKKGTGGFGGPDFDSFIYMPYKTAYTFNPKKIFISIYIQSSQEKFIPSLKEEIKKTLIRRYDEDDFSVFEQTEILNAVSSIFAVLNSILIAIGAISLIVGGIGIMNIMYVTVVERTKEIGIRRAIGATKNDILIQFMTESVILALLGGIGGIIASFIITFFAQKFFPAYIDITSVIIAFIVSSLIGILFGVFPAKKAANLTPVEAIRYE